MFMVILDPNDFYLAAKQPSREPNLELACDSSRQISSLLHCSCSQAVFLWLCVIQTHCMFVVIWEQNNFYVIVIVEPSNFYAYRYWGDKRYIFYCSLWDKTTSRFKVICEPNNIYVYGYLGAKQPQFGSQTTFKGATSGTFMCFLQTNLFIVTWFMEPSSFCFEYYVWSKQPLCFFCEIFGRNNIF